MFCCSSITMQRLHRNDVALPGLRKCVPKQIQLTCLLIQCWFKLIFKRFIKMNMSLILDSPLPLESHTGTLQNHIWQKLVEQLNTKIKSLEALGSKLVICRMITQMIALKSFCIIYDIKVHFCQLTLREGLYSPA